MWGQTRPFHSASDLGAVRLLARFGHHVARRVILRPTSSPLRDLRRVLAPSFFCHPRLIPCDQTSEPLWLTGIGTDDCLHTVEMDAALLRLELRPVRVMVLAPPSEDLASGNRLEWQEVSGGWLTSQEARAAGEALLTASEPGEPQLVIHLRNRQAAEPLSRERQQMQRWILGPRPGRRPARPAAAGPRPRARSEKAPRDLRQQGTETSVLRVRSIYVGERSTDDDLMAQIVLVVLQAGLVSQDSQIADWFRAYLLRFVSARAKRADGAHGAEAAGTAFAGLWKNAGNAEFAPTWRRYVKTWVRWAERSAIGAPAWLSSDGDRTDGDGRNPDDRDRHREEAAGALSSNRKVRREVVYAVPMAGTRPPEPLSVKGVADVLGLSLRHVFRLINKGTIRPMQRCPFLFDAADVSALSARRTDECAERRSRTETIHHLIESRGLTYEGARKAHYRNRKRTD